MPSHSTTLLPASKAGEPHSTTAITTAPVKPAKPYADFPLYAHATGYWAKKIRGRFHYFGPWADPDAALQKYLDQRDALHAGKTVRPDPDAVEVWEATSAFLFAKKALVGSGELTLHTLTDYEKACKEVRAAFGKRRIVSDLGPDDFARLRDRMAKKWGPHRLAKMIQCVRSVFKHSFDSELIGKPIKFGPGFKRPNKKTLRLLRAERGPRMFEAREIRKMLAKAQQPLRSMILLGVNCGYGNADCGTLPLSALDLKGGWTNYHRRKTGIKRRCKLWPETVRALKEWLPLRPTPQDPAHAGLVFLTAKGGSWAKNTEDNPVSKEMRKLLDDLKIDGHRNFYGLRHTFETVGGETLDQVAVDAIMGHADDSMASVYRERIGDERLRAVADHVRRWLFPPRKKGGSDERHS